MRTIPNTEEQLLKTDFTDEQYSPYDDSCRRKTSLGWMRM